MYEVGADVAFLIKKSLIFKTRVKNYKQTSGLLYSGQKNSKFNGYAIKYVGRARL